MREQGGLKKLPRAERVNIIGGEAVENIGKTRERHRGMPEIRGSGKLARSFLFLGNLIRFNYATI